MKCIVFLFITLGLAMTSRPFRGPATGIPRKRDAVKDLADVDDARYRQIGDAVKSPPLGDAARERQERDAAVKMPLERPHSSDHHKRGPVKSLPLGHATRNLQERLAFKDFPDGGDARSFQQRDPVEMPAVLPPGRDPREHDPVEIPAIPPHGRDPQERSCGA